MSLHQHLVLQALYAYELLRFAHDLLRQASQQQLVGQNALDELRLGRAHLDG